MKFVNQFDLPSYRRIQQRWADLREAQLIYGFMRINEIEACLITFYYEVL